MIIANSNPIAKSLHRNSINIWFMLITKKLALDRTFNVAGLYKLGLRFFSLFTHIKHSKNILAGAPFTGEQIVDASRFEQPGEQQNLISDPKATTVLRELRSKTLNNLKFLNLKRDEYSSHYFSTETETKE